MKVTLTDAERETLEVGAALIGWADADTGGAELKEAVEYIVAARIAEALREAAEQAMPISGYMGKYRWISSEKLRDTAAEYDPEGTP